MQFIKLKFAIYPITLVLLASCGGGGGGSSNTSLAPTTPLCNEPKTLVNGICSLPIAPTAQSLFSQTPIELPDLRPAFDQLCGNSTQIRDILPVSLTGNTNRKDLIITLNCMQPNFGSSITDVAKAGFVSFKQMTDGTFINNTKAIFGTDLVKTSGYIIDATAHDFNNDGYDDFILALNREDGRGWADSYATNLNDQNLFVTSDNTGNYTVSQLGQKTWNYTLNTLDNKFKNKNLISQPIGHGGVVEQWIYNGEWQKIEPLDWASHGTVFFNRTEINEESNTAVSPKWSTNYFGLSLYKKLLNWAIHDDLTIGSFRNVPWLNWSGETGTVALVTIDSKEYANVTLETSCQVKLSKSDSSQSAIFFLQAAPLKSKYVEGSTLKEGDPTIFDDITGKFFSVKVDDGKLSKLNFQINNEVNGVSPFRIYCKDVNNDSIEDIILSDWRNNTTPIIYINNGFGTFNRLDIKNIPGIGLFSSSAFIASDLNNDGFIDIIHYPTDGVQTNGSVKLKIFKGNRRIIETDLFQ